MLLVWVESWVARGREEPPQKKAAKLPLRSLHGRDASARFGTHNVSEPSIVLGWAPREAPSASPDPFARHRLVGLNQRRFRFIGSVGQPPAPPSIVNARRRYSGVHESALSHALSAAIILKSTLWALRLCPRTIERDSQVLFDTLSYLLRQDPAVA